MDRRTETKRLKVALAITSAYFFAELIAGFLTNSLALLSDAGHMLSDIGAIILSLSAFYIARRPATLNSTFGYHRAEIVAALFNGLALWLIVGVIFTAAYNRLAEPPQVQSQGMIVVAIVGLMVNVISGWILYDSHHENLNIRGAFLHIVSDAIGSVGAIVAGTVMLTTGWYLADPLVSIFIGLLILYSSWNLIRESLSILMQAVPKGIRLEEVQKTIEEVEGVKKVHDLHIWAVTSGIVTLSAHAVVDSPRDFDQVLNGIEHTLKTRFKIEHTTIQLELESREEQEFKPF